VTTVTLRCLAAPPRYPAYVPLSGAAKHPAGARPSKCIIIFGEIWNDHYLWDGDFVQVLGIAHNDPPTQIELDPVDGQPRDQTDFATGGGINVEPGQRFYYAGITFSDSGWETMAG
jgi:hypothetical protein